MTNATQSSGVRKDELIEGLSPPAPGAPLALRSCRIRDLDWSGARVDAEVRFERCLFLGPAHLDRATFAGPVTFEACTFEGPATFAEAAFEAPASFKESDFGQKATFEAARFAAFTSFKQACFRQELVLDGADFAGTAQLHNVRAAGRFSAVEARFNSSPADAGSAQAERYAVFSNSRFDDVADFTGAEFGAPARFVLCVFDQEARFPRARFHDYTSFDRARFNSVVIFQGARFEPEATLDLRDARIERIELDHRELAAVLHCLRPERFEARLHARAAQLRDALAQGTAFPSDRRNLERVEAALADPRRAMLEEGSRTLAVLHKAYNDSFNSAGEDWAYVALRRMERAALGPGLRTLPRRALGRCLDLTCGYGTSPAKVAISAVVIMALYAALYVAFHHGFDDAVHLRDALAFSFRTFTSSEIDTRIAPVGAMEWLVMSESLLGYVVMMLLVVTLSRLVIRS
jgi:hypothetical protein